MGGNQKKIIITVSNDIVTDQRMARISQSLSEAGYLVEMIGRKLKDSLSLDVKPYEQTRLNLWFQKGVFFYLELNIRLFNKLLFGNTAIIYAVDADTLMAASLIRKIKNVKLIYDAHELFSEVPELEGENLKKSIWKKVEWFGIKHASDLRYTVSLSIANYFESIYKRNFMVIRNCPSPRKVIKMQSDKPFIIYQGALNVGRGLEALIMSSANHDMEIRIAGSGDLDFYLKQLVKDNGFENQVIFLGKLLPDELAEITARAWLGYNLLEKKGLSYYYSLSNKTFDYINSGIPQLLPPFPEYESINQSFGFGYSVLPDSQSITNAIQLLLKDRDLYNQMSEAAIKASKHYTWENELPNLLKSVKELCCY